MKKELYNHFLNIEYLHGDASVQIPNDIFGILSKKIKNRSGSTNIKQTSFAYSYLVITALLYKYAHVVDIDNETYIQNVDMKELLGYNPQTKTIDHLIKNGGLLDELGLTETIKDFPVRFFKNSDETINKIPLREFVTISEIDKDDVSYSSYKRIVKNKNFTTKKPNFLFNYDDNEGTLYNYANTHKITIKEVVKFLSDDSLDNIHFYMYCFFKSKCKNYKNDTNSISLSYIIRELGICKDTFYSHLKSLKGNMFLEVYHKQWVMTDDYQDLEANEYQFKGVV